MANTKTVLAPDVLDDTLFTVDETAAFFGVDPHSVRRLIRLGKLDALKVGPGRNAPVRIKASTIRSYLHATNTAQ